MAHLIHVLFHRWRQKRRSVRLSEVVRRRGAASGKSLANLGEKCLHRVTEEGMRTSGTSQFADISRPLSSVRRICKSGNRVIFGMYGGVVPK